MLKKTSFAISSDESRYVLNGLYFNFNDGKLIIVATDGRRLALVEEVTDFPEEAEGSFIVPTKTVNELGRLLQNKGALSIELSEGRVAFDLIQEEEGNPVVTSTIISKLIDGSYPNYKQVIPNEVEERIALGREELLQALKRVELMTTDKSGSAKLSFTENNLVISANTPDVGEARESIAINYQGKDLAVAFNPTYLMDPLKALDNDEVFLELTDELSPGVVKINDPFLYVIMPMRLQ
jgi:DNA polymerase-3 subunit beta